LWWKNGIDSALGQLTPGARACFFLGHEAPISDCIAALLWVDVSLFLPRAARVFVNGTVFS
jgi:hypothetical protein